MRVIDRGEGKPRRGRAGRGPALAGGLAFVLLAGCSADAPAPLVVAAPRLPSTALLYLAQRSGCLADAPGEVRLVDMPTGRDAIAALRRGDVQLAVAYQTPVVLNAFEDRSLRILTSLHTATRNTHLVARRSHGIRGAADLRGKTIGAPSRTNAEHFVRTVLLFEGIDPSEVTLVDLAPERLGPAIADGRVDAVAVWSPHIGAAAAALGDDAVEIFSDVYAEASMLVAREQVIATRASDLHVLVRCVVEAARTLAAAPDGGQAIARQLFPEQDEAMRTSQWRDITLKVGLQNALVATLDQEAAWLFPTGDAGWPRESLSWMFAPQFLRRVEPTSVTWMGRPERP